MQKLLTSSCSSSPSSSSSTLSFDPTSCNSKSAPTAGCFTGILSKILCSGGITTHLSDQIRDVESMVSGKESKDQKLKARHNTEITTTTTTTSTLSSPRIVARLMGMESMAEVPLPSESTPISLSLGQSMNSADAFGECNKMQGLHRRVKSTSSFQEIPTFHLVENGNFLVLSFESGSESKEFNKSKQRKEEMDSAALKQKRAERLELKRNKREKVYVEKKILIEVGKQSKRESDMSSGNVGNDGEHPIRVSSEEEYIDSEAMKFSQPMNGKEVTSGEKLKRRKKRTICNTAKKIEIACNSEDASPVSVLDFEREDPGTEIDSFAVDLSLRRKLLPEPENDQLFLLHSDDTALIIEERKVKEIKNNNKCERSEKKEKQNQEYINVWREICRLAEDELVESYQIVGGMGKQGDFEIVSADFESEIFDHLLNELIDQLVGNPLKTQHL